jgi:hypothetical protein
VYRTLAHNAKASQANQLTLLLPKDNEQATGLVKQLYAMLEVAMMTEPVLVQEVGR